jgi:hypothetical protein
MTTPHMDNIYLKAVKTLVYRPALLRSESFKDYMELLHQLAIQLHIKHPMEWILVTPAVTFGIVRTCIYAIETPHLIRGSITAIGT